MLLQEIVSHAQACDCAVYKHWIAVHARRLKAICNAESNHVHTTEPSGDVSSSDIGRLVSHAEANFTMQYILALPVW
jgi:hypothetical protein